MMFPGKFRCVASLFVIAIVLLAVGLGIYQIVAPPAAGQVTTTTGNSAAIGDAVAATAASQWASQRRSTASASAPSDPVGNAATRGDQRRIHVFISGKVQGVGFRAFTQEHAAKLKLTGLVRNLRDGRVEVVAEGPANDISTLTAKIKQGPPSARVDKFDFTDETPTGGSQEFQIR